MKNPTVNLSDKDQKYLAIDWEEKASYLTQLIVPKNTIMGFPEELAKLTKLEVLDISCNRFTSLLAASSAPKKEEEKEKKEEDKSEEQKEEAKEKEEETKEKEEEKKEVEVKEEEKEEEGVEKKEDEKADEKDEKEGEEEGEKKEETEDKSEEKTEEKKEEGSGETRVLFSLSSLKSLLLAGNRLEKFGSEEDWGCLSSLEKVDLENNRLQTFPSSLLALGEGLASLNVGRNLLAELPSSMAALAHLQRLQAARNLLTSFPPSLCCLGFLQELDLSHNSLQAIPGEVGQLEALVRLDLSFNRIEEVPVELGKLAYLSVLNLRENRISALAEELFLDEAFGVEEINLQANALAGLPDSLWAIDTITSLSLSSNRIAALPPALGQLHALKTLLLADNCLEEVPEEIGALQECQELSLAWNKIKALPASIGTLANVRTLNVSYNELTELPELDGCDSLYELWVTGNRAMASLPASVFSRPRLGKLYASMLQLQELPDALADLEELEVLDVAHNGLSALPECLGELQILRRVNAAFNQLIGLPSLAQCYDMQNIDLSHNRFTAPPEELEQFLERGVEVLFDGNPLETPLAEEAAREVVHVHAGSRFPVAGIADMIGKRPTMEDAMAVQGDFSLAGAPCDFYGLYDGHAGRETASFCGRHVHAVAAELAEKDGLAPLAALAASYPETNGRFKKHMYSDEWCGQSKYCGTTAVSVLIDAARVAHVVNVGDSRAVLCRAGRPLRLSFDHKPYSDEEQDRIRGLGGCVAGETGRVNGLLAVSRSMGDFYMHPFVTDEPFQAEYQLEEEDDKLILACDGVWDEVSDERAVEIVMQEPDPYVACAKLRDFAYALGSDDNISVMIVHLKQ